jgi:mannosyltransferase
VNLFKRTLHLSAIVAGVFLIGIALVTSSSAFERVLNAGELSWGPSLFRLLLGVHGIFLIVIGARCARAFGKELSPRNELKRSREPVETRTWLILSSLSVIGLGLRIWHLNSDLWYDELISLLDFIRPPFSQIVTSFSSQNQHMLYSILAHASSVVFGESAAAVRLPSVAFGIASLWVLFVLGRYLISTRESLVACALMTVSFHHIWFSQNARGYTGLLFFSLLSTCIFIRALRWNGWSSWMGYAVCACLGMWVHMTMAFVLAAHALLFAGALITRRTRRDQESCALSWKPVVAGLLSVTLTVQVYALALPQFFRSALHQESLPSEWSSPWWVIIESLRSLRVGFSGSLVLICATAVFGIGFVNIVKRKPLAGLSLVLPAFLGGTTMLVMGHYIWPRFFFFSMGFAVLIAVHGAFTVPSFLISLKTRATRKPPVVTRSRRRLTELAGLSLASLLIAGSVFTLPRLYALPKQDFSGARNWIESTRKPDERVVAVGLAGVAYGRYFAPGWSVAQSENELQTIRNDNPNIWLVYTLPIQMAAYRPEIWSTIQKEFQTVEVFPGTLGGGSIYVCRQRQPRRTEALSSNGEVKKSVH